jgi:hypothetical protein
VILKVVPFSKGGILLTTRKPTPCDTHLYCDSISVRKLEGSCLTLEFFFFFPLVELGFELRDLQLQSRHPTTSPTPPVHFCFSYFGDGVW